MIVDPPPPPPPQKKLEEAFPAALMLSSPTETITVT